jgi:hypothetical protein
MVVNDFDSFFKVGITQRRRRKRIDDLRSQLL